jgi:hypothetical protein
VAAVERRRRSRSSPSCPTGRPHNPHLSLCKLHYERCGLYILRPAHQLLLLLLLLQWTIVLLPQLLEGFPPRATPARHLHGHRAGAAGAGELRGWGVNYAKVFGWAAAGRSVAGHFKPSVSHTRACRWNRRGTAPSPSPTPRGRGLGPELVGSAWRPEQCEIHMMTTLVDCMRLYGGAKDVIVTPMGSAGAGAGAIAAALYTSGSPPRWCLLA